MTAQVPMSESGTATKGIRVARQLRRNKKITAITRTTVSPSSKYTSCTDDSMLVVMSVMVVTLIEAGRFASSWGRTFWMELTTVMVLAPGWR